MIYAGQSVGLAPSGDQTGAADAARINAAVAALPSTGGIITLAATGPWYIECGAIVINRSGVYINAPGCYIWAVAAGDVFRMYDSSPYTRAVYGGGILGSPYIDGSNTTGDSSAFHAGDTAELAVFVNPQNFTAGTASKGVWLDNQYFWTEQVYGRIFAGNCSTHVQLDNSTGTSLSADATGSFDRTALDIYLNQQGSGDGIVLANGAFIIDGRLGVFGNFDYSSVAVRYVMKIIGANAGGGSYIDDCVMQMGVELAAGSGFKPATMFFDTANGCGIFNSSGLLDFSAAATFANSNNPGANFLFAGGVAGDFTLPTVPVFPAAVPSAGVDGNAFTIDTQYFGCLTLGLNGSYTGAILQPGFGSQSLTLINDSAHTLTFAAAGTSNVADGTSDVIAANTAATYVYDLGTSLWYRSV